MVWKLRLQVHLEQRCPYVRRCVSSCAQALVDILHSIENDKPYPNTKHDNWTEERKRERVLNFDHVLDVMQRDITSMGAFNLEFRKALYKF